MGRFGSFYLTHSPGEHLRCCLSYLSLALSNPICITLVQSTPQSFLLLVYSDFCSLGCFSNLNKFGSSILSSRDLKPCLSLCLLQFFLCSLPCIAKNYLCLFYMLQSLILDLYSFCVLKQQRSKINLSIFCSYARGYSIRALISGTVSQQQFVPPSFHLTV